MIDHNRSDTAPWLERYTPALIGATAFACTDVLGKIGLQSGASILTLTAVRGCLGVAILWLWLRSRASGKPPLSERERWISIGQGVLFSANLYLLFLAFALIPVPLAIITYFVYPLLTGLAAAALGLDRISWRGIASAVVALGGLAIMIGTSPEDLAIGGVVASLLASCCRVSMLLISRARLPNADAAQVTWYTLVVSTLVLLVALVITRDWQPPTANAGWLVIVVLAVTTTVGIMAVYASTNRVGPFHTALMMNLEPLLTTIGSALFLNELLNARQLMGGAIMLIALVAFQLRR